MPESASQPPSYKEIKELLEELIRIEPFDVRRGIMLVNALSASIERMLPPDDDSCWEDDKYIPEQDPRCQSYEKSQQEFSNVIRPVADYLYREAEKLTPEERKKGLKSFSVDDLLLLSPLRA